MVSIIIFLMEMIEMAIQSMNMTCRVFHHDIAIGGSIHHFQIFQILQILYLSTMEIAVADLGLLVAEAADTSDIPDHPNSVK